MAALAVGCAAAPPRSVPAHAQIAQDVQLELPLPPNFPRAQTLHQLGRARWGERTLAFDAVLTLSPDAAEIVIAAASGPRLATIAWDKSGVRRTLAARAPRDIPVENLLADVFLLLWPAEAVAAALPADISLAESPDGARILRRAGQVLVEITPDPVQPARTLIRNHAFGYEVSVLSQSLD